MKKPSVVLPTLALLVVATLAGSSTAHAVATDFLFSWGSLGSGDGQFVQPDDLAIGPNGDVFVLESGSQRIQKFTADGVFVTKWNSARPSLGPMRQIAIAADGGLYVLTGRNTTAQPARTGFSRW